MGGATRAAAHVLTPIPPAITSLCTVLSVKPPYLPEFHISTLLLLAGETFDDAVEPWRAEPSPQGDPEPPSPGRHRVLVAEDDPLVSSLIERLLAEQGYEVRTARHGEEALRIATRGSGAFDLVVTDVRMPVMDGWELSRRLQERWPGLPTLYISGYDVELTRGAQRGAHQDFLRKPFDADELLRHVARLLGER